MGEALSITGTGLPQTASVCRHCTPYRINDAIAVGNVNKLGCSCGFILGRDLAAEPIVEHCRPNCCDPVRAARRRSHPLLFAHTRVGNLVNTAF